MILQRFLNFKRGGGLLLNGWLNLRRECDRGLSLLREREGLFNFVYIEAKKVRLGYKRLMQIFCAVHMVF